MEQINWFAVMGSKKTPKGGAASMHPYIYTSIVGSKMYYFIFLFKIGNEPKTLEF